MHDEQGGSSRLTLSHMTGVLVGREASIVAAARDRATVWVGLILVFAAALAREYDGEDLRRQPWHLLIPLGASVVLSLTLFAVVRRRSDPPTSFWQQYRAFLGLFWLTAPMALLYAIPYERFLEPKGAVLANLWTLALVSVWRGLVTAKVVSVLTGRGLADSFFLAALVADCFAAVALMLVPIPVLQVMGGIRLTDVDSLLQQVGLLSMLASIALVPILAIIVAFSRWNYRKLPAAPAIVALPRPVAVGPFAFAFVCLVGLASLLPFTQPAQRLRSDAERLLRDGDLRAAVAEMSRHARSDYPPLWDPPPRLGWPEIQEPQVLTVLDVTAEHGAADWVRVVYVDKLERQYLSWGAMYGAAECWPRVLRAIDRLPDAAAVRTRNAEHIERIEERIRFEEAATRPTTRPITRSAP